ncbi:hypothetical protein C8Q76DRAFT_802701 [Earliella scabrosa]|nr:hypothetical protein C8Q76DRAFT_802701 [Earliella scabrosa]
MSRRLPNPTAEQIQRACDLSSQLYYAWVERPPTSSPVRGSWDRNFTKTCKDLIKVIGNAHFTTLPAFVIGCIWEFNNHCRSKTEIVDAEAIRLASTDNHPAFDRSSARSLCYTPSEEGPVVLQEKVKPCDVGPDGIRATATQHSEQPIHNPPLPSTEDYAPVNPQTRKRAASSSLPDGGEDYRADPGRMDGVGEDELCEQDVPETIVFKTGSGCDSCCKVDAVCEVDTFSGTVCKHCKHIKVKCSFMQINPKIRRCFLVWRFWKLAANGDDSPSLIPPQYTSESVALPAWWHALFSAKGQSARKRARTSEVPADVRRSRSASRAQSIAPSGGPSASTAHANARSAPIETRAKSKRRASVASEVLRSPTGAASMAGRANVSELDSTAAGVSNTAFSNPPTLRVTRASVVRSAPEPSCSGTGESAMNPPRAARKGPSLILPPPLSGSWRDLPTIERRHPAPQIITGNAAFSARDDDAPRADSAPRDDDAPPRAPPRDDDTPARDDDAPARDDDAPARDDDAPARDDDAPARDGDSPARDGDAQRDDDGAQNSLRSLHEELHAIAGNQQVILDRLDQIPGEALSAVQALLANIHQQVSNDLREPLIALAVSLVSTEMTSEARDMLLRLIIGSVRPPHDSLPSDQSGSRDDPNVTSDTSGRSCLSAAINQLHDRLSRVEGGVTMGADVTAGGSGPQAMLQVDAADIHPHGAAPDANVEALQSVVRRLEARIEKLETTRESEMSSMQMYLDGLGLDVDTLRRLAMLLSAPRQQQFPLPVWSWGASSQ